MGPALRQPYSLGDALESSTASFDMNVERERCPFNPLVTRSRRFQCEQKVNMQLLLAYIGAKRAIHSPSALRHAFAPFFSPL
jgi:hypothetical protein